MDLSPFFVPEVSAARPTLASSFRPNFARNSRLSLRLAPAGLTTVASARPVADDMVASGRSHSSPISLPSLLRSRLLLS